MIMSVDCVLAVVRMVILEITVDNVRKLSIICKPENTLQRHVFVIISLIDYWSIKEANRIDVKMQYLKKKKINILTKWFQPAVTVATVSKWTLHGGNNDYYFINLAKLQRCCSI